MDPPSNSGILTRASRRNRRSTITGLVNTPLGKSKRETLIGERIITNSGSNSMNNIISDLGSASRVAPTSNNYSSRILNSNIENQPSELNNISSTKAESDHHNKDKADKDEYFKQSGLDNSNDNQKLDTIESSNENTSTNHNKRTIHQEFQLDNNVSNNKRRKIDENSNNEGLTSSKAKNKRYLNNQMNHSNFNDLPMLGDLDDDDDDDYIQNANGVTNSNFHSAIKNRVLDKFMDNNSNNLKSPNINVDNNAEGPYQNPSDYSRLRNRDIEVGELKRSNELLTIKIATYLEDFKKIDTNGSMEEQFNKLVKWKHNYQRVSDELNQWKLKCEEIEKSLQLYIDNPSFGDKNKFSKLEIEIGSLKEENKKLQDSVLDVSKERNEFKDECDAIRYQKDTLEREKNIIALNLTNAEHQMKILESDLQARNVNISDLNTEVGNLQHELDLMKKKYSESLEDMSYLKANSIEKNNLEANLKLKNDEISKHETKLLSLSKSLKFLEESASSDKDHFNSSLTNLKNEVDEYKKLLNEKSLELKKISTQYAELEVESEFKINKLKRELESEILRKGNHDEYVAKLNDQIRSLNSELLDLQNSQIEKEKLGFKCIELERLLEVKSQDLGSLNKEKTALLNNISDLKEEIKIQKREMLKKPLIQSRDEFSSLSHIKVSKHNELKEENQQLNTNISLLNSKIKSQSNHFLEEIDTLEGKLNQANAKLNENLKDYMKLEDELASANEEKDQLKLKLQKVDQETSSKMDQLIEENHLLKLDLNRFSKTAVKYQKENTYLKDDLVALEAKLKKINKSNSSLEQNIEFLKLQKEQDIQGIKKQYIKEMRNLQEENLQLTENLTMFKNSMSSKSRSYGRISSNNERDLLIVNLQDQLKFFKNRYDQEASKNKDLQTMNQHYRKLVSQSTNDLRIGRIQSMNVRDTKGMGDKHQLHFFDESKGSNNDRYRYTSSEFNI